MCIFVCLTSDICLSTCFPCNSEAQKMSEWLPLFSTWLLKLNSLPAFSKDQHLKSLLTALRCLLLKRVSIAKFKHMFFCCSLTGKVSCNSVPSSWLLLFFVAKFITSCPQEWPDFNSNALCSIVLLGGTCQNGARWWCFTITMHILFNSNR